MPAFTKPTGKPQCPLLTAQTDFVQYTEDVATHTLGNKQAPVLLIVEKSTSLEDSKENIEQMVLCCEDRRYICSSIAQALGIMFKYFWLFHVYYPSSL